jgi:hypothetical protein
MSEGRPPLFPDQPKRPPGNQRSKTRLHFRLDDRCYGILESVRDANALPSLNAALNHVIRDYRRLQNEHERVIEALSIQSGAKSGTKS